jgi:Flp pilus assembly protein TadD
VELVYGINAADTSRLPGAGMRLKGTILATVLSLNISVFAWTSPLQRGRIDSLTVHGKLITPDSHNATEHIEVRIEKESMQLVQTAYTDGSGSFEFRGLPAGTYYISVNLDGYQPVRQQVDLNSFGGVSVSIFLNRASADNSSTSSGLDAEDQDIIDVSQMKENFPKKAVQDYEKALVEKKKGKLESAIKLLEEAIHMAPNFYHAHNNLGMLYQTQKRYSDAEKEYKRSSDLNAKNAIPLVNLGSLYIEEADLQKDNAQSRGQMLDLALDNLEAAVKLNPHSASAYYLLGFANYKSSFLEEAEAALKKAHDLNPKLTRTHLLLANIHWRQGKWPDVIENIDAYLKENPKAPDRAAIEEMRAKVVKEHSN